MSNNPQVTIGVNAIDKSKAVLQGVDQKLAGTADKVVQTSAKIESRTAKLKNAFKSNFAGMAGSMSFVGLGVAGLVNDFGDLKKAQIDVEDTALDLAEAEDRLEQMLEKGTASTKEIALQREDVRLKTEKLKIAESDLNQEHANFVLSLGPNVMSVGAGVTQMIGNMGLKLTGPGGLVSKLKAFKLASIAAFITNPVGAAIIGVTTLVSLLVFNVGGLRDKITELGAVILNFLDAHFKPLADGIRWFLDGVGAVFGDFFSDELPASVQTANAALDTGQQATLDLGATYDQITEQLREQMAKQQAEIEKLYKETVPQSTEVAANSFVKVERAAVQTSQSIIKSSSDARTALEALAEAQNRSIVSFKSIGQAGLAGTISVDTLRAAGLARGSLLESAKAGRLGGVFTSTGRVLDKGGTLHENVVGFGTETGTPHLLHKGETVTPPSRSSGGNETIILEIDGKAFAKATFKHTRTLMNKDTTRHIRLTHEGHHGSS